MLFKDSMDIFRTAYKIEEFKNLISSVEENLHLPENKESYTKHYLVYELLKSEIFSDEPLLRSKQNIDVQNNIEANDLYASLKSKILDKERYESDFDERLTGELIRDSEKNEVNYWFKHSNNITEDNLEKRVDVLFKKDETFLYDKYLKLSIDENNDLIQTIFNSGTNFYTYEKGSPRRVFLSYAVKDILTAISLFFIFREYNIFLYVDFLFNTSQKNIKDILAMEMDTSDQFLFLDAPNSMITVDYKTYIRPWCFWEHGYFLGKTRNKTTQSFRIGFAIPKGSSLNSESLKGYKVLTGIKNGWMV